MNIQENIKFESHNRGKNSMNHILAASSHGLSERELNDFYGTPPLVVELMLDMMKKYGETNFGTVWEPCAGMNHITNVLRNHGYDVVTSDINVLVYGVIKKDFFDTDSEFLKQNNLTSFSIITNPPYKYANKWYEHAMNMLPEGGYLIQFVKIQFLETYTRYLLFEKWRPKYIFACSKRFECAKGGDFKGRDGHGGIAMYAWVVTQKGYNEQTIFDWITG